MQRPNRRDTASERERKRARVERGAGDVLMEPRNGEQAVGRHVVASGKEEKQHEENRNERCPRWQKMIGDSK